MTVLQKPLSVDQILVTVGHAIHQSQKRLEKDVHRERVHNRLSLLSEGESKVLKCLMNGMSNKAISSALDVSPRTVDRHKKSVLDKMESPTVQQQMLAIEYANYELEEVGASVCRLI